MEPGDRPRPADVLVEDGRIVAVEDQLTADATVIDASNCIVLPGISTPIAMMAPPPKYPSSSVNA